MTTDNLIALAIGVFVGNIMLYLTTKDDDKCDMGDIWLGSVLSWLFAAIVALAMRLLATPTSPQ